ncbi:hypothetical protein [Bifidobacterium tibiigranuli]|uniref:hypothetical protein n=1 Tax=Bifidobacterium tibiigranuli TaxID=2172043 RepID=UPI0026EF22B3|nr:hypothetical protein [Bifidobacterium tibiigranuli]MCI2185198.1 hypothetical protein [Bifidobacterium tibiigranuli]MCI2203237.1 hypothetical protein [Bifidobacterium tibiigranuli]
MTTTLLTAPRPVLHLAHAPGWGGLDDPWLFRSTNAKFGYTFTCSADMDGVAQMALINDYTDRAPTYSSVLDLGAHLQDLQAWLTDIARVVVWATVSSRDWDAAREAFATA